MAQGLGSFPTILSLVRTTALKVLGKPGATNGAGFAGGTASGPPTTGQFEVGDLVLDATGNAWVCAAAGTSGAWIKVGAAFATAVATTISPGIVLVDHSTTPVASLWQATTPQAINAFTGSFTNYGQEFYSDNVGTITQISFYKGSNQVGTHTAGLYDKGTGFLLGSVTFTGETASGWQSQALIPPVPITAATHYVVAIHEPSNYESSNSPAPTPSSGLHFVGNTTYDYNTSLDFPSANTDPRVWAIDIGFQAVGAAANTAMVNPMTTAGDLIYGATAGASTRLVGGTTSQVLVGGTTPAFGTVPSAALTSVPAASLTGSHTVPDGTLSTNVPLLNVADTFTAEVTATDFKPSGLAGATTASRYVGGTVSAAPASGTFAVGDYVITQSGSLYICTTAGTPGTWTQVSGGGGGSTTLAGDTDVGITSPHDGDLLVYRSSDSKWHNYQPYAVGTVHWEPCSDVGGNLIVDGTGAVVMGLVTNTG